MRYQAVRRAERYLGLAVLAGVSSAAGAQDVQTAVLVSTGASVETNPYNTLNSGGANIAATAEIRPLLRWRGERSTIDMTGAAQFRQFFQRYGLEDNYLVNGGISTRVTERLTLRSNASFNYNLGGFNDFNRPGLTLGVPTIPPIPGTGTGLPDPAIIDPTLLGVRTRTKSINFGVGANTQLGTYSALSMDVTGQLMRFDQFGFGNFNSVGGQASYTHQLSEGTSVGVIGSVSRVDYRGTPVGDALTTSVRGSLDRRIGANWTLSGSAGLAVTRIEQLPGQPDTKFNSLTANVSFCNQGERGRLCIAGSRAPEPSAAGNVRVNNSLQADYSYRLTERENVTVSGSYAHTGRGRGFNAALFPAVDFVSTAVRYDNQIRDNLTFYTTANMSKIYSSIAPRQANFGVSAGVQYRFGALQ